MHPQSRGYKLLVHQYRLLVRRMHVHLRAARWEALRDAALRREGDPVHVELLQPRLLASATPYGSTFLVNQSGGATVRTPAVAEQAGGGFVAVWAESGGTLDSSGYGVYGRLYQANGTPAGSPFLVNQTTASDQKLPAVAINATGSFVVSWVSGTSVYARMYGPGGANPSSELLVTTGLLGTVAPGVGISSAGNAVVVYEGSGTPDTDGVYAQGIAANGTLSGGATLVNTTTTGSQTSPAVAMDGNGDYAVAWVSGKNIQARYVPAAGGGAAEGTASTSSGYTVKTPVVAIDSAGDYTIAWSQLNTSSTFDVYERRYNASQAALDASPVRVNSATGTNQVEPSVSMDGGGDFAVAWSNDSGSAVYNTQLQTYAAGGASNGQVNVNSTQGVSATAPAAAFTSSTNGVVVWWNDGLNATAPSGIYGQVYGTYAVANQAPTVTAPGAQTATENASLTFSSGNGNAISVADADAGGNAEQVTLGASHGTLTLSTVAGLTFTSGANASGAMTFTGTLANLNAALAGLVYTPASNYYGSDSVSVAINDQGNTGGNALTASASVPLTVYAPAPAAAAAASASPNPVTGTSTTLSVLGADANGESTLTYTWAATGTPPAPVTFSANGTNAAKGSSVTFTKAGTYNFQVTIAEPGAASSATSSVSVVVNQTAAGITVTPGTVTLNENATQQYSAVVKDQFGAPLSPQPAVSWAVTGAGSVGSVSATGLYTAPGSTGTATVQASYLSATGIASVTVANAAPTVATPAAASPAPVTGTTTSLSVLGADDGGEANLTYTWSTVGTPPAAAVFSANGTNAAKSTTATFSRAGTYNFLVTETDAGSLTATSAVTVTVGQTLTAVSVTPGTAALNENGQQQFTASAVDQFGQPMATQPTFTWSSTGAGSVNASGLYTAPGSAGSATVTATTGGVSGPASVTVTNAAPTVATPASASPSPVTGTSTALSVVGADDGGESNLTYTWATTAAPSGAPAPTFSATGTNSAKNATVSFGAAGSYTFQVTITDAGGLSTTSTVSVVVNPTVTTVFVSPASATVAANGSQPFTATAKDQFGNPLATQPGFTWSLSGGGSVNPSGTYYAPASAGTATVTAAAGAVSASAAVTVTASAPVSTPAGGETLVNTASTSGTQQLPAVAMDRSGNFVVVWEDGASGGEVNAQRYDASGNPVGAQFQVNTTGAGSSPTPAVAMDPAGDFVISWVNGSSVYARLYSAAGSAVTGATLVASTRKGSAAAAVAMHPDGGFLVAWEGSGTADSDGIYAQQFTAQGLASGSAFPVNATTAGTQTNPAAASDARGDSVIVWTDLGANAQVRADYFPAAGGSSGELSLSPTGTAGEVNLAVGLDGSGNMVVAGADTQATSSIYVERFNSAGAPRDAGAVQVNTYTGAAQTSPSLAVRPDGSYAVAWTSAGNHDGSGNGVFGQAYNADNTPNGGNFLVNTTTANNQQDAAAAWRGGNLVVAWDGNGPGDSAGVFFQRYATPQPTNQSPVNTVPGQQTTAQNTPLTFSAANSNAISVADADAYGASEQVTLTATNGTLTLSGTAGLTFSAGTGTANASMTFSGTLAALNAALGGLKFTPTSGFTGTATVQVSTNDLGNTGSGGAQTTTGTVAVSVQAAGQPANNVIPGPQTTVENVPLVFSDANGNRLAVGSNWPDVQLTASGGTVSLSTTAGLSFSSGTGHNDTTVAFTGSQTAMNAALNGLTFTPTPNTTGAASLQLVTSNPGILGLILASSSTANVAVTVTVPPNQPPAVAAPGAQTTGVNAPLTFSAANGNAISVSDPDAAGGAEQVTLTATSGTLALSGTAGLSFTSGTGGTGGAGDVSMTFTGTLAAINTALNGLRFTPDAEFAGSGGVTLAVNDQGNTGTGGAKAAAGSVAITIVNAAPVVAAPAAASPSPATGTTTTLSVLGADDGGEPGLTYTWAATGTPPAPVTFSTNGTNAAKGTTATFAKSGAYTFQVTIADPDGGSVTSSVNVTVAQALSSVSVTPAAATVNENAQVQFAATGYDQFGKALATQPPFAWSVASGVGSVSNAGLYTAPGSGVTGAATVTAASGGVSGAASVTVANAAPTVATPAAASPATVTGTTTALSVTGADDGGEGNLTYTWSTVGTPPAAVVFSANGTNAAKSTTATFSRAGTYNFLVTETDAGSLTATSAVTVTVGQTLTAVSVSPASATVSTGATRQFTATALDQFANAMASQPAFTWSLTAGTGAVDGRGLYTAPASPGSATVSASAGGVSGPASVTVVPPPNQPPALALPASQTTAEDTALVFSNATGIPIVVSDPDANGGTEQLSLSATQGTLTLATTAGLTFSAGTGSGDAAMTFTGTLAAINAAVDGLQFTPAPHYAGAAGIGLSVNDLGNTGAGGAQSASGGVGINVTPVAHTPSVTSAVTAENTQTTSGLVVSRNPIDGTAVGWFQVTNITGGTLYQSDGVTPVTNGQFITYAVATAGLRFTPTTNSAATGTFSVQASTAANASGLGGSAAAATITVIPPPVNNLPAAQSTGQNAALVLSQAGGNAISVSDPANNGGPVQVALSAAHGTLTLANTAGLTLSAGTGSGDAAVTFSGTLSAVNAALNGLTYAPAVNYVGADAIQVSTNDLGNNAAAESQVSSASLSLTITNAAPTVATPASASPSPVTGTTTALSVLGADDGGETNLTYTWAATGTPPAPVSFSASGTNAAKNATATFRQAGTYTLRATIRDASGLTATSSVTVQVQQTFTSITVSPANFTAAIATTQTFVATANDQFGRPLATQPAFTWQAARGTITSAGAYTAPASVGSDTVTATSGAVSGFTGVTVTNGTSISESPSPIAGATATLSVVGSTPTGVTYTWYATAIPIGASAPTASGNGTAAAQNLAVTFYRAGSYSFQVVISDGVSSTTDTATFNVEQTWTGISVSPTRASLHENGQRQFTAVAVDQFGDAMATQPAFALAWSVTGVGSVDANGLYTAPGSGVTGSATVTASVVGNPAMSAAAAVTVTNAPPTFAAAASASPNPVTGTSTSLGSLGADDGGEANLTYTWTATQVPAGASAPTFSANGTNAAKIATATFYAAGAYTFRVTATDASGATATSSVNVTVAQTLSTISVTPAAATLNENAQAQFAATGYDQFGKAMATQPPFAWSVAGGVGSVSNAGLYTAPGSGVTGAATVTAASGSISGTASVTVANAAPTVATPAAASPATVTGTTTALSVTGADDGGEGNLTYTWSTVGTPPAPVTFSANGTNGAKNTTATFSNAGTYNFLGTVTDAGGLTATSAVSVTVNRALATVTVTPGTATLNENATRQFTATGYDQFGQVLATQPTFTWASTGVGSVGASGLYAAPGAGGAGSATVTAASGGVSGPASVTVANATPTVATPAAASPAAVTGTSTALSVLGADDGGESNLTYTWSTTGSPPAPVTFSASGSNSAKSTTATFAKAGTYNFLATITDMEGRSTTSAVAVTVGQTFTAVTVSPAAVTLQENQQQAFAATARDQFGNPMATQPAFTWAVPSGFGSVTAAGVYTAPSSGLNGSAAVTATTPGPAGGTLSGSAAVTVNNPGPTITAVASASPAPATGATTNLSVSATSSGPPGQLIVTWSVLSAPSGAPAPTFSVNGTHGARSTTATFGAAGSYTFRAAVTDLSTGLTTTSDVSVQVVLTLTSIAVSPAAPTLAIGTTQSFTASALDQFGHPMATQPAFTWTASGGRIDASGAYTAPAGAGPQTVTASGGGISGSAAVTVANNTSAVASPSPVTANSSTLTVTGTRGSGLTYSWSVASKPAGAADPVFTANNSASASTTSATFSKAGDYVLQVTLSDGTTSSTDPVAVTVAQTLTRIATTPASAGLHENQQQAFVATGYDQFGDPLPAPPAVTWTVTNGPGAVDGSGLYTAPGSGGAPASATVTAAIGALTASASVTVTNAPPTIAAAPAASPDPADGTTTALSVLGDDDGGEANLTYTWSTVGTPPAPVSFSDNGDNSAKNATATFSTAGTYTLRVTATDAGGLSTTADVGVTVNPVLATITVVPAAPPPASLPEDGQEALLATGYDQFGHVLALQPAFTWAAPAGEGSVDASGLYHAPGTAFSGTVAVTATGASPAGPVSGSASVVVLNTTPTVAAPASASPRHVTGTSADLAALGADDGGEGHLTYTWAVVGAAPAPVAFSANGTHAAAEATATFSAPGTYTFQVTMTDEGGLSATSAVAVTVDPALTTLTVQPATATLPAGTTQSFTAAGSDQFGAPFPLPADLAWSATGGSINSSGSYTAPALAGAQSVTATGGGVAGSAAVTVTGTDPSGAFPASQATQQDTPLVFSAATGNAVTVTDAANPAGWVTVSLTARKGGLTLAKTDGLSFALGDGNGNLSMQFTGTVDAVNAALDGLQFTPFRGFTGSASVRFSVSDPATPGAPPTLSGAVNVAVKAPPAPPPVVLPGPPAVAPQSPFTPTPTPSNQGSSPGIPTSLDLNGSSGGSSATSGEGGSTSGGPGESEHPGRVPAIPPSPVSPAAPAAPAAPNGPSGRADGPAGPAEATGGSGAHPGDKAQSQQGGPPKSGAKPPEAPHHQAAAPPAPPAVAAARAAAPAAAPLPDAPAVLTVSSPIWHELDKMQESLNQAEERRFRVVAGTASFVSVGASVLYFAWVLRAGSLVTSLLSSMPAWQFVDPLPILDQMGPDALSADGDESEDDESLESMVADGGRE